MEVESDVVKVKNGWAVRLKGLRLEKPFHYKKDALALQSDLSKLDRWKVESTYTLAPDHYFRKY